MNSQVYVKIEGMNDISEDPFGFDASLNAEDTLFTETEAASNTQEVPQATESSSLYQSILQVGAGAMGEVFLARDQNLLRRVAYKKLHTQTHKDAETLVRFVREVQITAQLEHPNVIPVYHLEKTTSGWGYAMKLVFGKTLKALLQEAREAKAQHLPPPEYCQPRTLLEHFLNVCDAMAYAHEHGVIHRDLKPANIMVGPHREVYVMDWGIARRFEQKASHPNPVQFQAIPDLMLHAEGHFEDTQVGKILGTPRYLSPEQATGHNHKLDGRSDLFTLGLILQEMVSLSPAYQAKNMKALLSKVLKAEREPLSTEVPRELRAIIHKATRRKRDQRYPHVRALQEDLSRYLRGDAILAEPDRLHQAAFRWMKKHALLTAGSVVLLCILLGLLAAGSLYRQSQQSQRLKAQQSQLILLQNTVARQAHRINNHFLQIENQLKTVNATLESLLFSQQPPGPVYFEHDYLTNPPPDFDYVPRYAKLISTDHGVLKSQASSLNPDHLKALSQLSATLKPMFRQGALTWAHALLPDLYFSYPGKRGYPVAYRPQQSAWAQIATEQLSKPNWSRPYIDTQGQGILLSVAMPVKDLQGKKIGTSALALSLPYLITHVLTLKDLPIEHSYLLNGKGETMINTRDGKRMSGMHFGLTEQNSVLDTPLFDVPHVVHAIQNKKSGFYRYPKNGRAKLLAYYPLNALGWYYVVEVDEEALFSSIR